jgi:hypothetical protein
MVSYLGWVMKYKRKGRLVQKKRALLISDEFLGKITLDGFVELKVKGRCKALIR